MFLWIALQLKRKMLIGLCELSPVELGYAQLNWVELSIWQSISGILKKQYLKKYTCLANFKKNLNFETTNFSENLLFRSVQSRF